MTFALGGESCIHLPVNLPFVSVVMPIRNEEAFIERSLGAMLIQDYPADRFEILVVDGMSDDGTRDMVARLSDRSPVDVRIIDNPGRIVPPAMNLGIRAAMGDVIVRMDGHTIAASDYVSSCVRALEESGADNVGGCMTCVSDTFLGQAIGLGTSHPFGIGNAKFHYSDRPQDVDTVYLGCWRKEAFDAFGMFDEFFLRTQDSEFNYRTRMLGGRIRLDPRIRSQYYNRASLRKLWKQYFQYGFWKTRLMMKLGGRLSFRHFVAPGFVVGMFASLGLVITGFVLSVSGFERGLGWALIVAGLILPFIYAGASLLCAAGIARKKGHWQFLCLLPAVFATLHFSWGLGFMLGLIRRPDRRQFAPIPVRLPRPKVHGLARIAEELEEYPFVSVIMPVRNEERCIERSLSAMIHQSYPNDRYEILVVDGASDDRTREIVHEVASSSDVAVRLLDNPAHFVPSAMNIGIREANGEVIVRMDGHVAAAGDYIDESVRTLKATGATNVGGVVEYDGTDFWGQMISSACCSRFGCGGAPAKSDKEGEVDTVSFGCWLKNDLLRFGGFDEHFVRTQDSELNYRIRKLGGRVWMNPAIRSIYYQNQPTIRGLAGKYYQYGYWKAQLAKKLGWCLRPRHVAAPVLVLALATSAALLAVSLVLWDRLHILLLLSLLTPAVYFGACIFAALQLAHRKRAWLLLPMLAMVFPVLHVSWGVGFLVGWARRTRKSSFAPIPPFGS